jgi:hypothetical protein
MKYNIGDQVENNSTHRGQVGTITHIDPSKKCPYKIAFPGRAAIWHPENELTPHIENQPQSMDIASGFGIGGAGSEDYSMATEAETFAPQFSKRKSSGQLWEPCARRGCGNEPSCLDCGYCLDTHCHCGG